MVRVYENLANGVFGPVRGLPVPGDITHRGQEFDPHPFMATLQARGVPGKVPFLANSSTKSALNDIGLISSAHIVRRIPSYPCFGGEVGTSQA